MRASRGTGTERAIRAPVALYGTLMRALPKGFRDREGDDLRRTFEAWIRRRFERSGLVGVWRLTALESADLVRMGLLLRAGRDATGVGRAVEREVGLAAGREPPERKGRGGGAGVVIAGVGQAVRHLRARPGFVLVFIVTFALGVGVNAALFALVSAVSLRPPPYAGSDRMTEVWVLNRETGRDGWGVPADAFLVWREFGDVFEGVEAYTGPPTRVLTGEGVPERIDTRTVTTGLMEFLGVRPRIGRTFEPADGAASGPRVVVIGERLWARRFGRDADVLGRLVRFDGEDRQIVGVMPAEFGFPWGDAEAWLPLVPTPSALVDVGTLSVIGRLRPGVTLEDANARAQRRAELASEAGEAPPGIVPNLLDLSFLQTPERTKSGLLVLFGAVVLVLAIATTNILGLALANGLRRRRELAVRTALGAGRGAIIIQLFAEAMVLAVIGAAAGLVLARLMLAGLIPMLPEQLGINTGGRALSLWPDGVAFAIVAALLAAPVIGILPALTMRAGRTVPIGGEERATQDRSGLRLQRLLIVSEVALALVLLTAAGLLLNSFVRLWAQDRVVASDRILLVDLNVAGSATTSAAREARFEELGRALGGWMK